MAQGRPKGCVLVVNMRMLMKSEGTIAISLARKGGRGVAADRKASFMVQELRKLGMSIVGISETKWFGQDIYDVDGFLILHSGRPVPEAGEKVERNEGGCGRTVVKCGALSVLVLCLQD